MLCRMIGIFNYCGLIKFIWPVWSPIGLWFIELKLSATFDLCSLIKFSKVSIQLLFLSDKNQHLALKEIAEAIAQDAERKKVIFQAYMSSDVKEVASAHLMQNMAGGDIVNTVFEISTRHKDQLADSKLGNKDGLFIGRFSKAQDIAPVNIQGNTSKDNKEKKSNEFTLGDN